MRGELENHSVPSRQRSGQRATQNTQCKHQSLLIMPLNITLICNFMTENTPELFYNRALFPRATRAAGTCRAAGSVSAGCICKHETIITQVSDPQFSSESKMLCWWCLAMGKKKKPVWRGKPEQFVTATCPLWFLRTRSRLWQVGDRHLFINDPTRKFELGPHATTGAPRTFLSDSRSSLSLTNKTSKTLPLSNFFVSLRNLVSGSVDVGRRARALVSVQSSTNCRLFVELHLWMRSQNCEASLNTTSEEPSPLHLHHWYTWKGLSMSLYALHSLWCRSFERVNRKCEFLQ